MKMITRIALSSTFIFPCVAVADSVDMGNVKTFQSGAPAVAADVNSTLQALISAIDDNASRLTALEALNEVTNDLTGFTYCSHSLAGSVGGSTGLSTNGADTDSNFVYSTIGGFDIKIQFTSATSGTFAMISQDSGGVLSGFQGNGAGGFGVETEGPEAPRWDVTSLGGSFTYSFEGDVLRTVGVPDVFGDASVSRNFLMTPDRSSFIGSTRGQMAINGGHSFASQISIGVRSDDCQ